MNPKEKAVRLVSEHFEHVCDTNNWKAINMKPNNEPQFMAMQALAKKHAVTTVDALISYSQEWDDSEYWKEVKQVIEKL